MFYIHFLLEFDKYTTKTFVNLSMPKDARDNGVRFQWAQYSNEGFGRDIWLISNVAIGGRYIRTIHSK